MSDGKDEAPPPKPRRLRKHEDEVEHQPKLMKLLEEDDEQDQRQHQDFKENGEGSQSDDSQKKISAIVRISGKGRTRRRHYDEAFQCDGNHFDLANLHTNASYTWKSIMESRWELEKGSYWRIGDGQSVKIWHDSWLPRGHSRKVISVPKNLETDATVEELMTEDGLGWDHDIIEAEFWSREAELIKSIPIGRRHMEDQLCWMHTKQGVYSVKSAYQVIVQAWGEASIATSSNNNGCLNINWRKFWILPMPEKIKVFMRRVIRGIIPTCENLRKKCVDTDLMCLNCDETLETTTYCLRDFLFARQFWMVSPLVMQYSSCDNMSMVDWVCKEMENLDKEAFMTFCICLWSLWIARNGVRFNQEKLIRAEVVYRAGLHVSEVLALKENNCQGKEREGTVLWSPPTEGCYKINVDGAIYAEKQMGGVGIIARDHQGSFVAGKFERISPILGVEFAEAAAILKGVERSSANGWQRVEVESDSQTVIRRLKSNAIWLDQIQEDPVLLSPEEKGQKPYVAINKDILKRNDGLKFRDEGCTTLSRLLKESKCSRKSRVKMEMHFTSVMAFFSIFLLLISPCYSYDTLKGIDVQNRVVEVTPTLMLGSLSTHGPTDPISCERVRVTGYPRLNLVSYVTSLRSYVTSLQVNVIPERLHRKFEICFLKNPHPRLCQCDKGEWEAVQNGIWRSFMSPYEEKYVDVKFLGVLSVPVTVALVDGHQTWRLLCLALVLLLLICTPIVSSWGLALLKGLRLVSTGRKNAFTFALYGSAIGAGSFLFGYLAIQVIEEYLNFGLIDEIYTVSIYVRVVAVLTGAVLGYSIVPKNLLSEDGHVGDGIAQFLKWAVRIVAITFIIQITLDTILAMGACICCFVFCYIVTSLRGFSPGSLIDISSLLDGIWGRGYNRSTWNPYSL